MSDRRWPSTIHLTPIATAVHSRLNELIEELNPELSSRGFTIQDGHALWAKALPGGLLSRVISYAPDDDEGGWVEPFIGLIDEEVESKLLALTRSTSSTGLRHTLLIGSTKWYEPQLDRQPAHTRSEVLEVVNSALRWWHKAGARFEQIFIDESTQLNRNALDQLFNTDHPQAKRYLQHELYRALRGLILRSIVDPNGINDALDFHRKRMISTGYWDIYGEQIRGLAITLS